MITDASSLATLRDAWAGVEKLKAYDRLVTVVPSGGLLAAGSLAPEGFWNLPFVLAYSVLDQVLTALRDQGVFVCSSWMLGPKMQASRQFLPWQDFDLVSRGKDARNEVAHKAVLLSKSECFLYIEAVGKELQAWRVV